MGILTEEECKILYKINWFQYNFSHKQNEKYNFSFLNEKIEKWNIENWEWKIQTSLRFE